MHLFRRNKADSGEDPNRKDKNGDTPLHHYASAVGDVSPSIVKALLDGGAMPNVQNKRLQTALHLAKTAAMVRVIMGGGGDPIEPRSAPDRPPFGP